MGASVEEKRKRATAATKKYRSTPKGKANSDKILKQFRERHRAKLNAKGVLRNKQLRSQTFAAYGGWICACCGELEPKFLTLGHINNNGAAERRRWGNNNIRLFARLRREGFPPGYRVECYNCNCGGFRNGGTCPHVTG